MTAVLEQYLSTTAQPIQKQMCAENYKIFFRLMKFHFYAFFLFSPMVQKEMMGNLNGWAQYLHKNSTVYVDKFPTITA